MKIENKEVIDKILSLYTEENLNKITRKIIEAYKSKRFSYIIGLCNLIDDSIVKRSNNVQNLFSYLIMLYHPDRINLYKKEIRNIKENDQIELDKYGKIITVVENLDNIQYEKIDTEFDFDLEYEFGYDEEDFDSIIDGYDLDESKFNTYNVDFDFISLFKNREFGITDADMPSYYLEQLDGELNLSNSNLCDLTGLENCLNISGLDLSKNNLIDINHIGFLVNVTELNLSENSIQSIDALANLFKLKKIDISFNEIDDISPLFDLSNLEYINVIGNRISSKQIEFIKKKKIILVY
jgi:hypothetical protein